jgi:predicted Zn-dependent protease
MPSNAAFDQAFDTALKCAQQGRPKDALKAWRRASKIAPERPDVHYNLANTLKNLGQNKEAIKPTSAASKSPQTLQTHTSTWAEYLRVWIG